jgi:serine/threonine protein kinase
MPQELMTLSEGTTVQGQNGERFTIERLLATGGFSAIYLVRGRRTRNKLYVLKEISDPDTYKRRHLTFEGEILKRLEHPSLPHVYQVFENARLNRVYMLMDYIEGSDLETLREEQPEKRFSLSQTLTFMRPVIEAVTYLHSQQPPVVHRDIKPANIIVPIEAGEAKLVDFGLAKEYVEEKTTNIFRYGTPGYAAVEQYVQGTNPRTDIYAVGATIYTLLSGVVPVDALMRNIEQYDEDPLLPLHMLNQAIPRPLSDVIEKAMSLRSKDRYATVEEFWQAICRVSAGHPQTGPLVPDSRLTTLAGAEISRLRTHKLARQKARSTGQLNAPRSSFTQRHVHTFKKLLHYTLSTLLACIILGGATAGFLIYSSWLSEKPTNKPTNPEVACMAEDLTPATGNTPRDFPALAACYAGTISILGISNSKTNFFLFHIQQSQEVITGDCNGFGTIGTFSGSVTKKSTISFTVKLQNQERLLHFEGSIGSAGELVLSYSDLDQNGHKMHNEYGAGRLQAFTALDLTPTVSAKGQHA